MFLILLKLTLCVRAKNCRFVEIGDIFSIIYILYLFPDNTIHPDIKTNPMLFILRCFIVLCETAFRHKSTGAITHDVLTALKVFQRF